MKYFQYNSYRKCKCRNGEDLTNQTFGNLLVKKLTSERPNKMLGNFWICECQCKDKNIITVNAGQLKNGKVSSCGCSRVKLDIKNKIIGLLEPIEPTNERGNKGEVIWKCFCHGCEKYRNISRKHLTGQNPQKSCGCLKKSYSEVLINKTLTNHNINFIEQYTFFDLKSIKDHRLLFDFAVIDKDTHELKYLIEYQGEQHYKWVIIFDKTEAEFKCRQLYDKLKKDYCKENNIPLICIPYWEQKNINIDMLKLETTSFLN